MDQDKMPTKPVISSQWAADAQAKFWTSENAEKQIVDSDGLSWRVCRSCDQQVSGDRQFEVKLWLETDPSVERLIETGTLDPESDQRLVGILGEAKIPMKTKEKVYLAPSQEAAKNISISAADELSKRMETAEIRETKRTLIFRYVENKTYFGNA